MKSLPIVAIAAIVSAVASTACEQSSSRQSNELLQVDVSRAPGPQAEVSVAADPNDPRVLVAASNNFNEGTLRIYGSTDAGRSWSSELAPLPRAASAVAADPWVGIDLTKRQYIAVLANPGRPKAGSVYVLSRAGSRAAWAVPSGQVAPFTNPGEDVDDKDTLAVDVSPLSLHVNRIYVAWTRNQRIVVAHSDDQAVSWSPLISVSDPGTFATGASLSISRNGDVYLGWLSEGGLLVKRSTDGGDHWGNSANFGAAGRLSPTTSCMIQIPATPTTCANAFPSLAVDRSNGPFAGRVYAGFADGDPIKGVDTFVTAFTADLKPVVAAKPLATHPVSVVSDRFHPVMAVDQQSGTVWACFYDTRPDSRRVKTSFSCTVSRDGGAHWAAPIRAATTPSDETQYQAFSGHAGREYGDYEGLTVAGGLAHPVWTDSRDMSRLREEIYSATLSEANFGRGSG